MPSGAKRARQAQQRGLIRSSRRKLPGNEPETGDQQTLDAISARAMDRPLKKKNIRLLITLNIRIKC